MFWIIILLAFVPAQTLQPVRRSGQFLTSLDGIGSFLERREAVQSSIAGALSFLLVGQPARSDNPLTIVITGANSGIGFEASKKLAQQGHTLVLACRTLEKAKDTVKRIEFETSQCNLIPAECNLASLDSIRAFASGLRLEKIDVLCLNAGLSLNADDKQVQRTVDGFELTVGTNHLAHFLLNALMLPKMNGNGGRIVVTGSGGLSIGRFSLFGYGFRTAAHSYIEGGGVGKPATLGNLEGFERDGRFFEMIDGGAYNGDKAYKDSKLCNIMFTRELQRRLLDDDATKSIVANCFSPGLITSTGFFRNQNPLFAKVFGIIATNVARVAETPEWGGACLVYMATSLNTQTQGKYYISPPGSSKYGNAAFGRDFVVGAVSKEAQDDDKAKKLWELSEELVGIKA